MPRGQGAGRFGGAGQAGAQVTAPGVASIATAHVMVCIAPAATPAEIRLIAADLEAVAKAREGRRDG